MRLVAVLCADTKSAYSVLPGVEVFDRSRDARTFTGNMPIVAHPPCRGWSLRYSHMAKPEPGEMDLGLLCVRWLRECGGVLEQPAKSRLWDAAGLLRPCCGLQDGIWSAEVWQAWWGFKTKKATWLAFSKIDPREVDFPFCLHDPRGDGLKFERLSKRQRAATTPQFAEWLVGIARKARR